MRKKCTSHVTGILLLNRLFVRRQHSACFCLRKKGGLALLNESLFYEAFDWYARTHGAGDIQLGKYACLSGANIIGFYATPEEAVAVCERLRLPPCETCLVTETDVERAHAQARSTSHTLLHDD